MSEAARISGVDPTRAPGYFVNGPVDFMLIGGLSAGLYGLFRLFPAASPTDRMVAAGVLNVLLNWPHFSATSLRLYGSRRNIAQYPATATLAPLLAAGGVAGSLLSPLTVAPLFIKVFMLWSFYHFSGQTIGIAMIYARRFGFHFGRWERSALYGFVFLTAISWAAASDGSPGGTHYFGVRLTHFGLPPWAPLVLRLAMVGFGVLALLLVAQSSVRQRRLPPAMMLLPAVTQFIWFVPGPEVPAFYEFVQALHSVQYLLIAWSMHLHETAAGNLIPGWRQVLWQSGRWGAINLFVGAALFWFLPRALGRLGADPVLAIGVVSAGVQVHHFFVDGVIWKLKNRTTSSPLMMSFRDLVDRPRHAVEPIPLVVGGTP